jgi:hypothetical protein
MHDLFYNGRSAERQNRTDDTAIFSRVLYQLSYLGYIWLLSVRILLVDLEIVKQAFRELENLSQACQKHVRQV